MRWLPSGCARWLAGCGGASAPGESASALGVGRGVVELVVVIEGRLVRLRELLAVLGDIRRGLDLLLGNRYLQFIRTDLDPAQRHEGQVATDEALLDSAELGLVVLDVDVDVLQLADLLAVTVNQHLAVPLGDVPIGLLLVLGHRRSLLVPNRGLAVSNFSSLPPSPTES